MVLSTTEALEPNKYGVNGVTWERPLVNQNGSLYVTIPKIWCVLHGMKKGDKITIRLLTDGSLKVMPYKEAMP